MPTKRLLVSATSIGDKIYVAGGFQSYAGSSLATLEIYDPSNDTWTTGPNMSSKRLGLATTTACGKLYIFGGDTYYGTLASVEIYDPASAN